MSRTEEVLSVATLIDRVGGYWALSSQVGGQNHWPLSRVGGSPSGAIRVEKLRATRGSRETRLSRAARETRRTQLQATRAADCPKLVKGLPKRGMVSSQVHPEGGPWTKSVKAGLRKIAYGAEEEGCEPSLLTMAGRSKIKNKSGRIGRQVPAVH